MSRLLFPGRPNGRPPARSPGTDGDYMIIEPFQLGTPPLQQPSSHTPSQVRSNPEPLLQQQSPTTTPIYDQQIKIAAERPEELSRRHSQTIPMRASTDEARTVNTNPSARLETPPMSALPSQAPQSVPESRMPSAPSLPPGAAQPATYGAPPLGSHSNPQSPAGTQSPSQLWSTKPSPAVLSRKPPPQTRTMNGGVVPPPPRANGHASGNSAQYPNGRPGAESHDNGGEGSIHSEEKVKGRTRGFFGNSKEREREKEAQKELTRMIGFLTATASDDWTLVLELCERASVSESAAKEAARALRQEFKYADPPAQLSAARLWAIMLQNSNHLFINQTASKKFMETVESVVVSRTTSPVVRERLIDVLAAAAFTFRKEGFQSSWKRVRPPNKPEDGIPFDTQDSMFDPTMQGHRARTHASPTPQVTPVNTPHSPHTSRIRSRRQDSDQGHGNRPPGHRERELPQPPRRRDREYIPPDEDMRRLFEECDVALYNTRILNEALAYTTPDSFRSDPLIKEYYGKCKASHAMIIAQIPWASAGAARSQERREENPGMPDVTKEEKLLASLLKANEELVDVFKCYSDLEAASLAEQERAGPKRGRGEQKADATQFQYISPEGVPIPDLTQTQAYSGASLSSREPSPSRGAGKPASSRDLPPPPSAFTTPTQPQYGHHHSQSSASINLMPPPPAPHGPRHPASHPRSRTPSPERQFAPPHQAPQAAPAVAAAIGAINATAGVGFPTSSPPSSEPQYPTRHAPPPGPPPLHLHYPTTREPRIDSLRSINSVNLQGHGVAPGMRVDVGTANAYAAGADEEEMKTPIRPSEKALGKRRAALDAEPDEVDLQIREETELEEAMLRSQSPYVNGEEEEPVMKIQYVYDAAAERAKELAAEEAAELAGLVAVRSRQSLDKPPSRTNSNQSSV